ncbi:MAG: hypothetical protein COA69_13870 [Robiginitomaculum sp.]|nr:MAG: hypothetical protein COA69_13870 [Robiginitomaculum sp.]
MDEDFKALFVDHWVSSKSNYLGFTRYLQGLDFKDVDRLEEIHAELKTPVHFIWGKEVIWGKENVTFPVGLAKKWRKTCQHVKALPKLKRVASFYTKNARKRS